ncbi:MAG: peptidoglycan DD-metalloendopeptidase family protein [Anaerolineales bacterium]|nr:peptidoglycan DD-metalloendopeptidase family protein [Anaerolineales bacterium]MCS7248473.1 peptidoglycan DD-metalloendopeptidase family protein [Anaerolineales bacterium]MDW8162286.1 peptidoglycan DD-metalloendopeptidase family protein [Anaerolineales bacterium]MDW8447321.1 peptidoglycan DD-metalloendopeptidase family protein [Anaerolineales bacterium]
MPSSDHLQPLPAFAQESELTPTPQATPLPTRPVYLPGELVDYTAQSGDTLPLLALRFNTSVEEILEANPFIPHSATTMPPGMPMKIPVYYSPLWGSPYKILPDSVFVNGPRAKVFDTATFLAQHPGWLNGYQEYAARSMRSAAEIIDYVARHYSISPMLLLALLEYHSAALTNPEPSPADLMYPLGYANPNRKGLYSQLSWTANLLNNGYYAFRAGQLLGLEFEDGREERFDPWLNAATAALHHYFNALLEDEAYRQAVSPEGFSRTYQQLFGDPWLGDEPHIPGSLEQPPLRLPFLPGETWAYTGGPHSPWGSGQPFAALDFAPPSVASGCIPSDQWVTAVTDGIVTHVDWGELTLDLDEDADDRTGWAIYYLHISTADRVPLGTKVKAGDPIGHPSCEGGTSTGTHIHVARRYNGEWILAEGVLAFNLEGWVAYNGPRAYLGYLKRNGMTITASDKAVATSHLEAGMP